MTELSKKIGEMDFDGLVTDLVPPVQVRGGIIAHGDAEVTYKRGTVLAKDGITGKLSVLGTSGDDLTADCILCDDTTVGESDDAPVAVYIAGCFDLNKVTVAEGYTMTQADQDKLRERGIVFKAASAV
jgi:hypothetical protein